MASQSQVVLREIEVPETQRRPRVAFVVQRCGLEVNGGAEGLCLKIGQRMVRHWDVEILTTCALDYMTWRNEYAAGCDETLAVKIRRFKVAEQRDVLRFNRLSEGLVGQGAPSSIDQEEWLRAQGPWSPALFAFVGEQSERYDAFFFFGYLYAQTYFSLPAVQKKSVLVPLAHDEWMIHLGVWSRLFRRPSAFVFNSQEELEFLRLRFPDHPLNGPVLGIAVDRPADINPERFRAAHHIRGGYLLYVGRIDSSKGCDTLFDHFQRYVDDTGDPRQLVLLGGTTMSVPSHSQITHLGFVSERDKWDALAGCDLLVMPSPYESLSMALLEAWSVGKPVLVNGDCAVLKAQCRRSNGGVWYRSYDEFLAAMQVLGRGIASNALGRQGYAFVNSNYQWPRIEEGYLAALEAALECA
ncbi:MAG: glycosyltransferase [Pseudomonadota bacterium]|nr:glycosyltransferase [Pseudomonadota bacterium]